MSEPLDPGEKLLRPARERRRAGRAGAAAPEVEWTEAEGSPYFAGTVKGAEAVVSTVLAPIGAAFDDFARTPSDFIAEAGRVAASGPIRAWRGRPGGASRPRSSTFRPWRMGG
ncbi:MAG: hypothetical protein WDM85_04035 [Caulobacteraceae bacterium]